MIWLNKLKYKQRSLALNVCVVRSWIEQLLRSGFNRFNEKMNKLNNFGLKAILISIEIVASSRTSTVFHYTFTVSIGDDSILHVTLFFYELIFLIHSSEWSRWNLAALHSHNPNPTIQLVTWLLVTGYWWLTTMRTACTWLSLFALMKSVEPDD